MRGTTNSISMNELNNLTDERLMDQLQAGVQEAFTVLYRRYYRKVKGNICNRLRGELLADADDVVQEVFTALHRCTARFIKDSYVSSFLLKTTHRLVVNHIKHNCRLKRDIRRRGSTVHEKMADDRATEKANAAEYATHFIERLTPAEAEVVRLIDIEGHTAASAAEVIDAPLTTAQWRYRKAWEHMKKLAKEEAADASASASA